MTRIAIVARPDAAQAQAVLQKLLASFRDRNLTVVLEKETAGLVPSEALVTVTRAELPAHADLLMVLGGDGTLLSMARSVAESGIPLLGVNLGGLGFLTATTTEEMVPAVDAFLAGQMAVEERMMLAAQVMRGSQCVFQHIALNDVVITKSAMSRIINLSVTVEDQTATAYRADGLIISTPTGSTAYCLSAGGPILFPTMDAIVLVPIASHTLTNRPIVLPGTHRLGVTLQTAQEVMLTLDGQVGFELREHDRVEVAQSPARVRLIRFPERHFFSVLRTKLKWGER